MTVATEKAFYLAAAFAARFSTPGGKYPNVHLEFRFGELTVFAGDGRNVAFCKLAVPPVAYCDVGITPAHMASLLHACGDRPLTLTPTPEGGMRSPTLGSFCAVERPERADWLEHIRAAPVAWPGIHEVASDAWGKACLGLNTLGNFPSMNNALRVEPFLDWHILRPVDTLREGILEAWALVARP